MWFFQKKVANVMCTWTIKLQESFIGFQLLTSSAACRPLSRCLGVISDLHQPQHGMLWSYDLRSMMTKQYCKGSPDMAVVAARHENQMKNHGN